ncbi:MAG: SAM-dependent methyltransferase, partial [Rickettsiales bacterium]
KNLNNQEKLQNFRNEIKHAISKRMFKFGDFNLSDVERAGKFLSFKMICTNQKEGGIEDLYDIRTDDQFIFSINPDEKYFSTNMSDMLFRQLMVSCPISSEWLRESLEITDYFIVNNSLARPETKELMGYLFKGKNGADDLNFRMRNLAQLGKTIDQYEERDLPERYDPLSEESIEKVGKEIVDHLREMGFFEKLPIKPVIIDVGCGRGENTLKIKEYLPNCVILGIEPIKEYCEKSISNNIDTYFGFVEDLPEGMMGKADRVTCLNINLHGGFEAFFSTLTKLLSPEGKLFIGRNKADTDTMRNGIKIDKYLSNYFDKVDLVTDKQKGFAQDIFVASQLKEIAEKDNPEKNLITQHQEYMFQIEKKHREEFPRQVNNLDLIAINSLGSLLGKVKKEKSNEEEPPLSIMKPKVASPVGRCRDCSIG